jgi:uncharacterized protein (TIGR02594 family)
MKRFFLVIVALCCFCAPAQARHHHSGKHHRHTVHHIRPKGAPVAPSFWSFLQGSSGSDVVSAARREIGNGAIYGRRRLWCARFLNVVLARTGHRGTGSDLAHSFASLPRTGMHVGAIAVMSRRGGGHVGIVSGVTANGDPIVISGNSGHRVREGVYSVRRVVAFVEAR